MREDRKLPDKDEIATIDSVDELTAWLECVEDRTIVIETQLEHRSDDAATEDWERRAQGALVAHRICAKNLRAAIHKRRLGLKGTSTAVNEGKSQTKAANKATNAVAESNAIERKRLALEAMKITSLQSAKRLIERIDYSRLWQACAHEVLTAEQIQAVNDLASLRHREAMTRAVEEAAA